VYVIWWLVNTVEGWLRRALIALGIVSPEHYWPASLNCRLRAAAAGRQPGQRYAARSCSSTGTIFWAAFFREDPVRRFRDVLSLLPSGSGEKRDLQRVVLARFADVRAIGFVTREDVPAVLNVHGPRLGHRVFPHELRLRRLHALSAARPHPASRYSVEDAMRLAITAGLTAAGSRAHLKISGRERSMFNRRLKGPALGRPALPWDARWAPPACGLADRTACPGGQVPGLEDAAVANLAAPPIEFSGDGRGTALCRDGLRHARGVRRAARRLSSWRACRRDGTAERQHRLAEPAAVREHARLR